MPTAPPEYDDVRLKRFETFIEAFPRVRLKGPRVGNVQDQDISTTNLDQLIHNGSDLLFLHHGADGDPSFLLQGSNGRSTLSGGNLARGGQFGAGDIVLAKNVLVGGWNKATSKGAGLSNFLLLRGGVEREIKHTYDTTDARCEKFHHGVLGVFGFDEDSGGFYNGVDGFEAGCLHGFTGFCKFVSYSFHGIFV